MSPVSRKVEAPPETVFAMLSDPRALSYFILGTKTVRKFDARWPEVGTELHYTVGLGPLQVRDRTVVTECEPPHMLAMQPHLGPILTAEARFELRPEGSSTVVVLDEKVIGGALMAVAPLLDMALTLRNRLDMVRFAHLVELRYANQRRARQADP